MNHDVDYGELRLATEELFRDFPELHQQLQELMDDDPPMVYTAMNVLARRLIADVQSNDTDQIGPLFDLLDEMLRVNGFHVRNLLISGFLEDLQNHSEQAGIQAAKWERWMGPQALVGWRAVADFWQGRITGPQFNSVLGRSTT